MNFSKECKRLLALYRVKWSTPSIDENENKNKNKNGNKNVNKKFDFIIGVIVGLLIYMILCLVMVLPTRIHVSYLFACAVIAKIQLDAILFHVCVRSKVDLASIIICSGIFHGYMIIPSGIICGVYYWYKSKVKQSVI